MGLYRWDSSKNDRLLRERSVSFEEVLLAMEQGRLLDIVENPNREKYKDQKAFVVEIRQYVYFVPFVDGGDEIFLKTVIPSRKLTRKYLEAISQMSSSRKRGSNPVGFPPSRE